MSKVLYRINIIKAQGLTADEPLASRRLHGQRLSKRKVSLLMNPWPSGLSSDEHLKHRVSRLINPLPADSHVIRILRDYHQINIISARSHG